MSYLSRQQSPGTNRYLRASLERLICHEICMVHDNGFGGALHEIAFDGVRGNDVAYRIRDAAFHRQGHASEGVAQQLPLLGLTDVAIYFFVLQELADIGKDG